VIASQGGRFFQRPPSGPSTWRVSALASVVRRRCESSTRSRRTERQSVKMQFLQTHWQVSPPVSSVWFISVPSSAIKTSKSGILGRSISTEYVAFPSVTSRKTPSSSSPPARHKLRSSFADGGGGVSKVDFLTRLDQLAIASDKHF
jgi:hypothetical protein